MNTSDQAAGQMAAARNKIVHSFARWAALSALRSGCPVKSRAKIYPLLDALDFNALFDHSLGAIDPASFAIWHRASVDYLSSRSRHDSRLGVGWAAKLVNVYLKTSVYVGGLGRARLVEVIHPPIDAGLWAGFEARFGRDSAVCAMTHSRKKIVDISTYRAYLRIIDGFRLAASGANCHLIEVEQWWQGADSPSV